MGTNFNRVSSGSALTLTAEDFERLIEAEALKIIKFVQTPSSNRSLGFAEEAKRAAARIVELAGYL